MNKLALLKIRLDRIAGSLGNIKGIKIPPAQLKEITELSDIALDKNFHYGTSKAGSFGYIANQHSAQFALSVISFGETNIEKISDAVHQGWATAFRKVKDPAYDNKEIDEKTGLTKGEKKYNARKALADKKYSQLEEGEKKKDRVVAIAILEWAKENGWVGKNK